MIDYSSQITFLYFNDLDKARVFFEEILELERVFDPKWSCVWKVGEKAFLGGVDIDKGSIEVKNKGGILVSLNVKNIEEVYEKLKIYNLEDLTAIKYFDDIHLKSFLFSGPEGYKFEIQEFMLENLRELF